MNGLQEIPLIGYGRLRYLADELGMSPEQLMKPEPGHARRRSWPG